MTCSSLSLNSDKTEALILGPKDLCDTLSNDEAALDDIALTLSTFKIQTFLYDKA